ncbi:hypothetical protein GSI_12307 [Ganoderma sinense ZZ0214-1]|uniref:Uncharacterized protein n=1 Tax=Ganoderma sinense ZZ0214-1 TaxID=1077348 RepID=A0A2G8RYE8_9APHY|nr:hypothetical protein GSI_12307 [Ganoderma sinense ZZ0214-1]
MAQAAQNPSTNTPSAQKRRPTIRTSEQAQPAVVMGPPATPAVKSTTPSHPQRQSKVDALAKKVWNTVAPGAGRKRANPAANPSGSEGPSGTGNDNSDALPDMQPPVSKKRKAPVDVHQVENPRQGQQGATGTGRKVTVKATPRVQVSVDSDSSAVESDDDVPLKQRQATASSQASTAAQPGNQKPLTRGAHAAPGVQPKARVESAHDAAEEVSADVVESDASNSADEYTPDEDDEAYSEEDELEDPLSEDIDELEAQLREEAPVWTKEKDEKLPLLNIVGDAHYGGRTTRSVHTYSPG